MHIKNPYIHKLKNASAWCFLLIVFFSFSAVSPNINKPEVDKFTSFFKAFVNDPALAHASIGFSLIDTENGQTVYEYNAQQSLIPASVQKIVATGATLGILGADYTFKTILSYDSLSGTIYIIGGGDPTLGSDRVQGALSAEQVIKTWTDAIESKIKNKPFLNIAVDANHYEKAMQPANWAWNDLGNYYGAGACGLSFHENYYTIYLNAAAKEGGKVDIVKTEPEIQNLRFANELKAGAANSGDNAYIFGAPYNYNHFIRGTIPAGSRNFAIKGSVPDPALFCAGQLVNSLKNKNPLLISDIKILDEPVSLEKLTVLSTIVSPPLKDIAYQTNLKSLNLYAEHLLKECGYKILKDGSTESGIKAIQQFWKAKGINTDGFFMYDGSGLSHSNAITASQLAQILNAVKKEKYFSDFYNSLPVAGQSGAMKNMGNGTVINGKLRAKTGHIDRIRSYAGYSASGKYAFALVVNNYTCSNAEIKNKIEKVLIALGF